MYYHQSYGVLLVVCRSWHALNLDCSRAVNRAVCDEGDGCDSHALVHAG